MNTYKSKNYTKFYKAARRRIEKCYAERCSSGTESCDSPPLKKSKTFGFALRSSNESANNHDVSEFK